MCLIQKENIDIICKRINRDCTILLVAAVVIVIFSILLFFIPGLQEIFIEKPEARIGVSLTGIGFGLYVFYITPIRRRVKLAKYAELMKEGVENKVTDKMSVPEKVIEDEGICKIYYELLGTSMLTILLPIKDFFSKS